MLRTFFALPLFCLLVSCVPVTKPDSSENGRPSKFLREVPVNFGGWLVQNCTLQFHTADFILSTKAEGSTSAVTFTLQAKRPLERRPQLAFNTSDFVPTLEGQNTFSNKDLGPIFRFDIPLNQSLLPQLYKPGAHLILTYLNQGSATVLQNFFNTKNAIDGLRYMAQNCQ